ncbi:hypothetical protein PI124_g13376 [Phytophthora idaei]|nr:hypothetical protein PI125_g12544 [Phytophthora idaei]KAG3143785.1 hypothetical protein PI126_g14451 [Phytophthora idaei]KAG3241755.1 hypothetical protein PI124_g13376 [Phytophthora idaei]
MKSNAFSKKGADFNRRSLNGITILELSCANGQLEVLIKHGAHVDVADDDGDTALMAAIEDGHDAVVQRLLECGASIDLVNNDGWTSLMKASMNGHSEIVAILLPNGACVDKKDPVGATALHVACESGHLAVVKLLVENGASISVKNKSSLYPIVVARKYSFNDVVDYLSQFQPNPAD